MLSFGRPFFSIEQPCPRTDFAPALIQFFDNSTGAIDSYHWDFGDGITSTLPSPTHTYTIPAVYTVSLTVWGAGEGSNTITKPNYITVTTGITHLTLIATYPGNNLVITSGETISATFNQPINPASVTTTTFTVWGQQSGVYEGVYQVADNSVWFTPNHAFKSGEEMEVSLSSDIEATNGITLTPYSWQFRMASRGGSGLLGVGQQFGQTWSEDIALGDLDSDGDLDAFIANGNTVNNGDMVWFNDGRGQFSDSGQRLGQTESHTVALGDLDSDGDLDAFVGGYGTGTVWLNDGAGQFEQGQEVAVGEYTIIRTVALGDLNGDGDLDALMNDDEADTIWLNNGAGQFEFEQSLNQSYDTHAVALGDVNADGRLDIVGATNVWLNNGDGGFSGTGQNLGGAIVLGDLNGDGHLDALVSSSYSYYGSTIWLNDGSGQFTNYSHMSVEPGINSVALGDLDGDGDLDAFLANAFDFSNNWDNISQVWLNDGSGVFTLFPQNLPSSWATAAALGDLDNDGDLDALTTRNYDWGATVWLNHNLAIQMTAPITVEARAPLTYSLVVTNVGHLPLANVVVTNTIPTTAATYLGGGTRIGNVVSWTAVSLDPGDSLTVQYVVSSTQSLVNRDYGAKADGVLPVARGNEDVVTFVTGMEVTATRPMSNDLRLKAGGTISATFSRSVAPTVTTRTFTVWGSQTGLYTGTYDTQIQQVQFAPAANFKAGEEVVVNLSQGLQSADGIALLPYAWQFRAPVKSSRGIFTPTNQSLEDINTTDIALGDLDSDGDVDAVVMAHPNTPPFEYHQIWLNQGAGVFTHTQQISYDLENEKVILGDLDGDGDLDAFVLQGHANRVWRNDGGGQFTDTGQSLAAAGHAVTYNTDAALGDLDGDGDLDVFVTAEAYSSLPDEPLDIKSKVWLNDGSGYFTDSGQRLGQNPGYSIALGNVDSDGDLDALVGGSDGCRVWLNNGRGKFDSGQHLTGIATGVADVALGDLDGDGDLDAFVVNANDLHWWDWPAEPAPSTIWLNYNGTFVDSGQRLDNAYNNGVALGDVDGDSDLDAVVAGAGDSKVWLNQGNGVFTTSLQSLVSAKAVTLGDLDGDGDLDAFIGTTNGSQVWLNVNSTWQFITTTNPPAIVGEHAMAYDSGRDVIVVYGGNATGWPYEDTTWELTGTTWLSITTTTSPPARYGMQMAYTSSPLVGGAEGGLILFGGSDANNLDLNQTWHYTNSQWLRVYPATSPLSRTHHSMAANPISGTLYLFGGNDGPAHYNDLWRYEAGNWSQIIPITGTIPPARSRAALAYDPDARLLLLFGGRSITGMELADLWAFDPDAGTWFELDGGDGGGGPPARLGHSLTYDVAASSAVLAGGSLNNGDTRLGDTWHYNDGWSEANPVTALPPRAYHQAVYTPAGIVLFSHGEVWKYE